MKRRPKPITFGNIISDEEAKNNYGFIYKILFDDGSYYIGQKSFKAKASWITYQSSQSHIKQLLKTNEASYEILMLCKTKKLLTYYEMWFQMMNNVLTDEKSLNKNICGKYFRRDFV